MFSVDTDTRQVVYTFQESSVWVTIRGTTTIEIVDTLQRSAPGTITHRHYIKNMVYLNSTMPSHMVLQSWGELHL